MPLSMTVLIKNSESVLELERSSDNGFLVSGEWFSTSGDDRSGSLTDASTVISIVRVRAFSVNRTAFERRFKSTCANRTGSPLTHPTCNDLYIFPTDNFNSIFLTKASRSNVRIQLLISIIGSKGISLSEAKFIHNLPSWRTSSVIRFWCLAHWLSASIASRLRVSSSSRLSRNCDRARPSVNGEGVEERANSTRNNDVLSRILSILSYTISPL